MFLDVRDLGAGAFDEALAERIRGSRDVVVVLTPGSLEDCRLPDDWLARELSVAFEANRNVVPIRCSGFEFGDVSQEGAEVRRLALHNGPSYSHEHAEASIDRLCEMLRSPRSRTRLSEFSSNALQALIISALLVALGLVGIDVFGIHYNINFYTEGDSTTRIEDPSIVAAGDGEVRFVTERFEPAASTGERAGSKAVRLLDPGVARPPEALELAFQIVNTSSQSVSIGSLDAHLLGEIRRVDNVLVEAMAMRSIERMDLGTLVFSMKSAGPAVQDVSSQTLLDPQWLDSIDAQGVKSFLVKVGMADLVSRFVKLNREIEITPSPRAEVGEICELSNIGTDRRDTDCSYIARENLGQHEGEDPDAVAEFVSNPHIISQFMDSRTNLTDVLEGIRDRHPVLWKG